MNKSQTLSREIKMCNDTQIIPFVYVKKAHKTWAMDVYDVCILYKSTQSRLYTS